MLSGIRDGIVAWNRPEAKASIAAVRSHAVERLLRKVRVESADGSGAHDAEARAELAFVARSNHVARNRHRQVRVDLFERAAGSRVVNY